VREHEMTSQEPTTPTTAGAERKTEGEERKDGGMQRMPRLPLPGGGMPVAMPTGLPGRVLWWGGLAALAAFEVVDWPVAVLVGAGEWVAEQYAKSAAQNRRTDQWNEASKSPSPS
jgi:hypothetical protein